MSPELTLRQYTINFQVKLFYELIFNTPQIFVDVVFGAGIEPKGLTHTEHTRYH